MPSIMPPKKRHVPIYIEPSAYATHFVVKAVTGAGQGLFARQSLPANTRIAYTGKEIDKAEYKRLESLNMDKKNAKHKYIGYIFASGKRDTFIDANPRYPGSELWYAGRVNEPSTGVTANMVAKVERPKGEPPRLVFVTVRPIEKNEELTLHYGPGYTRVGYRVGRTPKKPSWL